MVKGKSKKQVANNTVQSSSSLSSPSSPSATATETTVGIKETLQQQQQQQVAHTNATMHVNVVEDGRIHDTMNASSASPIPTATKPSQPLLHHDKMMTATMRSKMSVEDISTDIDLLVAELEPVETDDGTTAFGKGNRSLLYLNLSSNRIQAVEQVKEAFQLANSVNPIIQQISLEGNPRAKI